MERHTHAFSAQVIHTYFSLFARMAAHAAAGVIDFVALSTWVAALSLTGMSRVPLLCVSFIFHLPTHYFGLACFLWLLTITNRQAAIEPRAAVKPSHQTLRMCSM